METLYRKVQFEIDHDHHEQTILVGKHATFSFNPNTRNGEELTDFLSGCEEISDNTAVIEKLEADKEELLEALEIFIEQNTPTFTSHDYEFPEHVMKAKSLIQKHKQ